MPADEPTLSTADRERIEARWVEDVLLAHHQSPFNTQGVRAKNRAPKYERPQEADQWVR